MNIARRTLLATIATIALSTSAIASPTINDRVTGPEADAPVAGLDQPDIDRNETYAAWWAAFLARMGW